MLGREPRRFGSHRLAARCARRPREALAELGHRRSIPRSLLGTHSLADAAARRHRAGDLDRRQGARARRADLEPRPRRGRRAVPGHPRAEGARRRDPVRLALPRAGLRDLRPHHGAAQRQARRRVPDDASCCASTSCRRCSGATPTTLDALAARPVVEATGRRRSSSSARGVDRGRPASPTPTSTSSRARCSASPGCSARGAPSSRGRSRASTGSDAGDHPDRRTRAGSSASRAQALSRRRRLLVGEPQAPRASSAS